jgi:hypothetical protein
VSHLAGLIHHDADVFFVDTGSGAGNVTFIGAVEMNYSDLDVRSGEGNINFVMFALSTTAATVTNIAGTVELGCGLSETAQTGIALSPVLLTSAGTTAEIVTNSWWPISAAADASGNSVSQAGNNTLVLGTSGSMNEYVFNGDVTVASLVTTLSSERYHVSVPGSLNVTGAGGTTFNNRGALRIGVSSADIHQLNGSRTVAGNTSMTLSGQLTANGNVAITPRVTVQSAGPALLAANGGTLTVGEVFVANGVNLTLGSATTSSISTSWICGTGHATAGTVSLQSAGSITIADVISGLTDLTLVNSTGTDFGGAVTVGGNLQVQNTTGTVIFRGNVAAGAITAAAGSFDLQLLSGATSAGATSLVNTGTVTLGDGPNMFGNPDAFVFGTGFNRSGGPTQAFANIRTTNSPLSVAGSLTAIGNSVLRSGNGLLTLADVVLSSGVTLDLGAGDSGSINLSTAGVASGAVGTRLRINSAGTVTTSGAITGVASLDVLGNTFALNGSVGTTGARVGQIIRSTSGTTTFGGNLYATGFSDSSSGALSFLGANTGVTNAVVLGTTNMVTLGGNLTQAVAGTGTTTLRAASIGGDVNLQSVAISPASGMLTSAEPVTLAGTGSVSLGSGANINAGSSIVRISAGSGGFVQSSTSTITSSSNDATAAVQVLVTGGNATLGTLTASHASGRVVVTITGTGSILDGNDAGSTTPINTTGSAMVLSAAGGTIGTAANPTEYSSGTLTTPNNASTTVFIRDASPNAASVIGTSAVKYRVRLPSNSAGPYEVRAYFGDRNMATNTVISGVSGTTITSGSLVSNLANPLAFPMAAATVSDTDADGILTFQFARPTGYTGYWSVIGMDIATGTLPDAAPQVLTGLDFVPGGALTEASQAQLATVERRGEVLSEKLILEVREQVLAAWATTGLSAEAMALLQSTTVEIRDMNDRGMLGASGAAGTSEIWLDDDALGYGWSFTDDADVDGDGDGDGDGEPDLDVPAGTIDLATVMAHEYGHLLGWQDLDPQQYPGHLMAGELAIGERRGVETLDMVARGSEPAAPEVSVVVPPRGVDVFREEEVGDVGAGMVVVPVRGGLPATGSLVKKVESESNGDLAGDIIVRDRNRSEMSAGIDSDLSLIDDLFADLSLLQ